MTHVRGFSGLSVLIAVLGLIVIGGAAYLTLHPETFTNAFPPQEEEALPHAHEEEHTYSISWTTQSSGERDNIPYTKVAVVINGTTHDLGEFQGSCSEIGESGGVDGGGLLAGELSAVQCWFAGGGDEIGVFAHEDHGVQVLVGRLEESIEGSAGFRGDFHLVLDLP